ncbi:hypothetical protein [Amycolatopsis thailandensis]|uniref:hypothetical protein n=1 Tax=Amycolatopsis thailandensis TaxID=589330 RepID=UPI00363DEDD8
MSEKAGSNEAWYLDQPFRGGRRRFVGEVTYVGGAEGQRVRREIASALASLLSWARQQATASGTSDTEDNQAA